MKLLTNILKVLVLIIGVALIAFNAQLYLLCKQQRDEISAISEQQKTESQVSDNKFKYQQDQIEGLKKDLDDARQQIKDQNDALAEQKSALVDQKDALLQEVEKRQQVESAGKYIQTSLVDIKAEADAIKQDMKGWQKDYVTVLAQMEKKMDDSQEEIKALETNLTALNIPELKENINSLKADLEKINHPPDNAPISVPSADPDKKIQREEFKSQY